MHERVLPLYAATRLLALALLIPGSAALVVHVYFHLALTQLGPVQGLWEYPWPFARLLQLPLAAGASSASAYAVVLTGAALVVDAAYSFLLWRSGGRRMTQGLRLWLLALPALGPIPLLSVDVLPAVIAGGALLALGAASHAAAGTLLAAATALKLWPLAGLPALAAAASARGRWPMLAAFGATGLTLAAATLIAGGWPRLWSPWVWQQARGLQIEAFAALPFLWARYFGGTGTWDTPMTRFNAYEVKGPGVDLALSLGHGAMLLALAAVATLYVRAVRAPSAARTPALAALLFATSVIALLATSKVLSPQYLVWVVALAAALGSLHARSLQTVDLALVLGACALTQVVYPLSYDALVRSSSAAVLAALTLRDALLAALGVRFALQAWRAASSAAPRG